MICSKTCVKEKKIIRHNIWILGVYTFNNSKILNCLKTMAQALKNPRILDVVRVQAVFCCCPPMDHRRRATTKVQPSKGKCQGATFKRQSPRANCYSATCKAQPPGAIAKEETKGATVKDQKSRDNSQHGPIKGSIAMKHHIHFFY